MGIQDYIYAGFTKGGGTEETPNWKLIPNTEEAREEALKAGYNAFSIMSVSYEPDKGKPEPLRRGPLVMDFDSKDCPEEAIKLARNFLRKFLQIHRLHADSLRYWISGGKGCHIEIPASVLGSEEGHPYLHEIYKGTTD